MTVSDFEAFYRGTAPRLMRFAYGLTGGLAEAQDLTQEAYARAWQRWATLHRYDNPEAWLRLVVTRLATDWWRRLAVRRSADLPGPGSVPPPDEELMTLVAALRTLPIDQRRVLAMHYLLDQPVAEIATELAVPANTVKSWLARGRANLAAALGDRSHVG
ncbi:SigE family RNA polymerase sigma factor [Catellatospora sp. NPDC049609]|uniref:RNA polymerase sigma factor n=1 Tax=Catellatospora sp. NPDC049609 TaxID=3155505 RepID=UPI0034244F3D